MKPMFLSQVMLAMALSGAIAAEAQTREIPTAPAGDQEFLMVDTGSGSTNPGAPGSGLFNAPAQGGIFQWIAGKFTFGHAAQISSVEGWMRIHQAGTVIVNLYADAGNLPGERLFQQSFAKNVGPFAQRWEGFGPLGWQVPAGTYWISFEAQPNFDADMISGAPFPLAGYAFFNDQSGNLWLSSPADLGVRVRGASAPVIISPLSAQATVGRDFVYQLETRGADTVGASNLPAGLTFDPTLRAITGRPTGAGTFQIGLSATNTRGTTSATLVLTVQPPPTGPVIASSTAVTGRTGLRFSFQVFTSGATSAARVTATGLPPGLTIDSMTGVISGIATTDGSYGVNLLVTGGSTTTTGTLQMTFTSDLAVPVITSASSATLTPGQPFSYTIVAPAETSPSDTTTFALFGNLPAGLGFDPVRGVISGTYNGDAPAVAGDGIDLSGGVITNVQLFATNGQGTTTIPVIFFLTPTGVANISTRLAVGDGENVLIAGFIITGNAPKKVVILGRGPSLNIGGVPVPGTLPDPVMELRDPATGTLIGSNDDWRSAQEQEIIDTTVAPTNDREAAMIAILNPGSYTAIVKGKPGATSGITIVELYDLGTASLDVDSNSKLANLSTRGFVQTGDNIMIGGFIIRGSTQRVVVRAIGPLLAQFGVAGAMQDPTLELHGPGGLIAANDDWRSDQEQELIASTVAPTDDRESAVIANLPPGAYTAVVRGKNGTSGVALVELYLLN